LDVPQLHFVGMFTVAPSTINNTPQNYGYDPAAANVAGRAGLGMLGIRGNVTPP
jgi:hypothetical protein